MIYDSLLGEDLQCSKRLQESKRILQSVTITMHHHGHNQSTPAAILSFYGARPVPEPEQCYALSFVGRSQHATRTGQLCFLNPVSGLGHGQIWLSFQVPARMPRQTPFHLLFPSPVRQQRRRAAVAIHTMTACLGSSCEYV